MVLNKFFNMNGIMMFFLLKRDWGNLCVFILFNPFFSLLLSAYGIDIDLRYRHGIMVFKILMVLTHTHGIVLVFPQYTYTGILNVA